MPSVTFKCNLITPMFMSGADQRGWEIRSQSIKGMMAFWWRAMNAHVPLKDSEEKDSKGEPLQKGLQALEGRLFGSTESKSKFKIRVNSILNSSSKKDCFTYRDIDQFGARYLLFSMRNRTGARDTYKKEEDTAFELKLSSTCEEALAKTLACFWLLSNLGGIGSRSRRGGGNLHVSVTLESGEALSKAGLQFSPQAGQSLRQYLHENCLRCKELLREYIPEAYLQSPGAYSHLEGAQIVISDKEYKHPMDALNDIGLYYLDFRQDETLTGEVDNLLEKAPMGLPIVTRDKITIKPEHFDRRASPLLFRVLKNAQGKFLWAVLKLEGQILPEDEATVAQNRGRTLAGVPQLNRDIIDEFFTYIQNDQTELVTL